MIDISSLGVADLSVALAKKQLSSEELVQASLERAKGHNEDLNAFISFSEESALCSAREADRQRSEGEQSVLGGIPYAHKDIFCSKGDATTCASRMLADFVAPYDATVTRKLREAGMVMLGKTNMDEFAMGSSSETSYFGAVRNPWDLSRVPGGSSGGSAAAVAARLAPCATGTDTGGSIRQPAALCGVTGIKPTYGRVSRYGMVAFASSLDQAGVFAVTVRDCALLLNAIAGFDEKDSTSVNRAVPDYTAVLDRDVKGTKIGVPEEFFTVGLDAQVAAVIDEALAVFSRLGCRVKKVAMPSLRFSIPVFYILATAECSSNLARYDGVRFGHRSRKAGTLDALYVASRDEGFGAEVKRRIMLGTYVLSAGYYDAYYLKAQKVRRKISDEFSAQFADIDVLLSPVTPDVAFHIGEKMQDPVQMYLSDVYTTAVNLAGLPALALPAGFKKRLPVGIQLIGNYFCEEALCALGHAFQQTTSHHLQFPQRYAA